MDKLDATAEVLDKGGKGCMALGCAMLLIGPVVLGLFLVIGGLLT
jgi:hypothetical protein